MEHIFSIERKAHSTVTKQYSAAREVQVNMCKSYLEASLMLDPTSADELLLLNNNLKETESKLKEIIHEMESSG